MNKPRLVFDFIRSPVEKLQEVDAGKAPRESLLGYIQLRERGWPVSFSDDRWSGWLGSFRQKLRFKVEIPSVKMIAHWCRADIVIVTTRISLILVLIAKTLGKKVVFLDAMCEEVPARYWRRIVMRYALQFSDGSISLSNSQANHWAKCLEVDRRKFRTIPYGVDLDFYKMHEAKDPIRVEPYLLAVGRDPRRDFSCLARAARNLNIKLKLVTQRYLVSDEIINDANVEIFDGLSYEDLFRLYAGAIAVVIPVKKNTTYMSGIRAAMESMVLGVPVISSRLQGMLDYFSEDEVCYFETENVDFLMRAIGKIERENYADKLLLSAGRIVREKYDLNTYAQSLENELLSLCRKSKHN